MAPDTKRVKEGALQTLGESAIPGYARTLPEAHDVFGEPMHKTLGGAKGVAQAFLDPSQMKQDTSDDVTSELQRLNVGIASLQGIREITEDEWDRTMTVNLKSMLLTIQAAIPRLEEAGGLFGCHSRALRCAGRTSAERPSRMTETFWIEGPGRT